MRPRPSLYLIKYVEQCSGAKHWLLGGQYLRLLIHILPNLWSKMVTPQHHCASYLSSCHQLDRIQSHSTLDAERLSGLRGFHKFRSSIGRAFTERGTIPRFKATAPSLPREFNAHPTRGGGGVSCTSRKIFGGKRRRVMVGGIH